MNYKLETVRDHTTIKFQIFKYLNAIQFHNPRPEFLSSDSSSLKKPSILVIEKAKVTQQNTLS